MSIRFWKARIFTIVLLPLVAAILLAGVSVFQGYLHRHAGFDDNGRPLVVGSSLTVAPGSKVTSRPFLSTTAVMTLIRDDLKRVEPAHQPDCRYFSLAHRYNDLACTDDVVERERQAFRKLVRLVSPVEKSPQINTIDAERVVFRVRLSELGWTHDQWDELARHYRYGLSHFNSTNSVLRETDAYVREAVGGLLPLVRADWFVATLVRPPLGGPGGTLGLWTKTPPDEILVVADSYSGQPVGLEAAARELGTEPELLRQVIASDEVLSEAFGLGPFLRGKSVTRETWESDKNLTSPFQELAKRLGLGKPVVQR